MRLETARLLLREFREEDIDPPATMCADAEVMRYLSEHGAVLDHLGWPHLISGLRQNVYRLAGAALIRSG